MATTLTAKQVQFIKPEPDKRLEVPAGPPSGFYLVVHPTGAKSWALRYRWHGAPRKLTLSKPYPELSLAAARAEAEAALANLRSGIDPAAAKAEEEERAPNSVRQVADEWLERRVKTTRTYAEVERLLTKEVLSKWKHKMISDIGRADVLRLLDGIVDRGSPITANRTLSILKRWFGWCVERGILETSPVANIRPPAREKSRERVLGAEELAMVCSAAERFRFPFAPFLHLLILTAQRRGEVAAMRWEDLDLERRIWTLPAEFTKPGRVHDVPLSAPAVELLVNLPRFKGPYIFTTTSGTKPINGFSKWKRMLDAAVRESRGDVEDLEGWTLHDLRRTAATWMAGAGVPPQVLSALLNHSPGKIMGITSVYNRFRYLEERREALEKWGEYVLAIAKQREEKAVASA